ncbi:unnamed protein product [Hermetia illucens]|uniref:VPS9 domain-containing protein n=1 Tax=Hermetia illucens TaxID=343691 RepID=A0A7R8UGA6_HERIL|nr:alsin homolog [Hermetia illucens]CAD7080330.1 unnamed protein product [Hermetia illucens]
MEANRHSDETPGTSDEGIHPFSLYYGDRTVNVITACQIGPISRLCCSNDGIVFILNKSYDLYMGSYDGFNNCISLDILKEGVVDIDLLNNLLHIVKDNGSVYKINISTIPNNHWEEVTFPIDNGNEKIRIARVKSNTIGTIFITDNQEAYGYGCCGEILDSDKPIKLDCFKGKRIFDVSAGLDFFVFLAGDENQEDDDMNASTTSLCDLTSLKNNRRKSDEFVVVSSDSTETLEMDVHLSDAESDRSAVSRTNQHKDDLQKSIKLLIQKGRCLVNTSVHSFGARNGGILGTGDHIKRTGINFVLGLNGIGVCSISCGRDHSIARTIDGRLFQWGMNNHQQIQPNGKVADLSAPKELKFDENSKSNDISILEACCGELTTFLLNNEFCITEISNNPITREFVLRNVEGSFPLILTSNHFIVQNHKTFAREYEVFLTSMQTTVKNMLHNKFQIEFLKYIPNSRQGNDELMEEAYELYRRYLKVTYILVLCLQTVDSFYRKDTEYSQLLFVEYSKEVIQTYVEYSELYCDIKSIDGFQEIKKTINCVDIGLYPDSEDVFYQPFLQISNILKFLECLEKQYEQDKCITEALEEWRVHFNRTQIEIELAENSNEFWQRSLGNTQLMRYKQLHRRVILDSNRVPLRLSTNNKFTTSSFILFSDFFCQCGGGFYIYPLSTMWIQIENEVSMKVTTPEKRFTLVAKSHEHKKLWYDQFEKSINAILEKPVTDRMPKLRCAGYKYSDKHPKYGDVWCYGRWKLGEMHGVCHLEFPDGKVYFGEMRHGDIEGFGKMLLPSVGMYEGSFRGGKFHGYGIYEMRDNEIYEGNFRDGLFEGHGTLRGNTYTYVGQFAKNAKHGYGILDDAMSGDKYMGMFVDNKRSGPGICITMNGDYFEGIYRNDVLSGDGLAIFENGNYYEGELGMHGPSGHGKYYIPQTEVQTTNETNDSTIHMKGSILAGTLSGNWDEVKVTNGTASLNQIFLKYPDNIGDHIISNSRKWHTLFENWEEEVFGGLHLVDTNLIWNKIAVYMKTLEDKEKIREHDSTKVGNYFAKNITMQMNISEISLKNSLSLDKISLRSTNSLNSRRSSSMRLNKRRKSYSNEILFDRARSGSRRYRNASKNSSVYSAAAMNWKIFYDSSFPTEFNALGESKSGSSVENLPRLEFIPHFGIKTLSSQDLKSINEYLGMAFKDRRHPLYILNQRISNCFYLSYGCWKVKPTPVLSSQAMDEWELISMQMYRIIQKMFPALSLVQTDEEGKRISHISLLYPIVLSEGIYSTLFVLYANKYSQRDELYRQRLLSCEKKTNNDLIRFLSLELSIESTINNPIFNDAIATLKMVKEKYCPHAMLVVIKKAMQLVEEAYRNSTEGAIALGADNIMPLAIILVLRAEVPHLGAELALLEDLLGSDFESVMLGFSGYCYTTIKATYEHIISDKFYHK